LAEAMKKKHMATPRPVTVIWHMHMCVGMMVVVLVVMVLAVVVVARCMGVKPTKTTSVHNWHHHDKKQRGRQR
jgi:hypothetical protein